MFEPDDTLIVANRAALNLAAFRHDSKHLAKLGVDLTS
jgi:hypothetical protein